MIRLFVVALVVLLAPATFTLAQAETYFITVAVDETTDGDLSLIETFTASANDGDLISQSLAGSSWARWARGLRRRRLRHEAQPGRLGPRRAVALVGRKRRRAEHLATIRGEQLDASDAGALALARGARLVHEQRSTLAVDDHREGRLAADLSPARFQQRAMTLGRPPASSDEQRSTAQARTCSGST